MENSVIAVQIANGTFVPVLNTSSKKRRRLVATTVRDNQANVKINLFRGSDESMSDAEYVGSLVVDNVQPAKSGDPDISVLLGIDEAGNLNATAKDNQSGEYQSLSVNLEQMDEEGGYGVADFQLSDEELTLDDLSLEEEDVSFDEAAEEPLEEPESDVESELDFEIGEQPADDALEDLSFEDLEPMAEAETEGEAEPEEELEPEAEPELEEPGAPVGPESVELDEDELEAFDEVEELEELDELDLEPESAVEPAAEAETEPEAEAEPGVEEEEPLEEALGFPEEEYTLEAPVEEASAQEETTEEEDWSLPDFEESLEDVSLEEAASSVEEDVDTLADISDEDFAFDESLSEEDFSIDSDEEPDTDRENEPVYEEGMVEAELGEEDFTFDQDEEVESLFPEPSEPVAEAEIEDTLSPDEFDRLDSQPVVPGVAEPEAGEATLEPRRSNAIIFVGYMILALAALGVLAYLVFRLLEGPAAPPLRADTSGLATSLAFLGFPGLPFTRG